MARFALLLGCGLLSSCNDDDPDTSAGPGVVAVAGSGGQGAGGQGAGGQGAGGQGAGSAGAAGAGTGGTGAEPSGEGGAAGDGAGGAAGGTGELELAGTPTRPLLTAAGAEQNTILRYLAQAGSLDATLQVDNWDPTAGIGDVATFASNFRVAAEGGTHTTVQEAITAAVTVGGTARQYIEVAAGTYPEVVCVPSGAPPITLYSTSADASQTVIEFDNYSGKPKEVGASANPCNANTGGATYGTSGSATFAAYGSEFQAKNLSFVNSTDEATAVGGLQGVALMTQADRLIFENVRVLGNQDSLYVKTPNVATVVRAYFKGCYVEGDTDFIFGRGTFVLDGCTIHSLTSREEEGVILAPSTAWQNPYGILITGSTFTADGTAAAGSIHLGRAWDESQGDVATYAMNVLTGTYPNGQALIRESTLGPHIQATAPWRPAATTARPYSSVAGDLPANRLYEYQNTGPGSAQP